MGTPWSASGGPWALLGTRLHPTDWLEHEQPPGQASATRVALSMVRRRSPVRVRQRALQSSGYGSCHGCKKDRRLRRRAGAHCVSGFLRRCSRDADRYGRSGPRPPIRPTTQRLRSSSGPRRCSTLPGVDEIEASGRRVSAPPRRRNGRLGSRSRRWDAFEGQGKPTRCCFPLGQRATSV